MMRASGILVGMLLMLAVFLLVFSDGMSLSPLQPAASSEADIPAGSTGSVPVEDIPVEDAVDSPPPPVQLAAGSEADRPGGAAMPVPVEELPVEDAVDSEVSPVPEPAGIDAGTWLDAGGDGLALDSQSWNQSLAGYARGDRDDVVKLSRYLVWTPFRSEWAAEGFARRLTLATEVPVEVISEGPGNYQVVFSYRDDDERQAMVAHIEDVTGLELE